MAPINGTSKDDVLEGTPFKDSIFGFVGNDILRGLAGNDTLNGGKGNDTLNGEDSIISLISLSDLNGSNGFVLQGIDEGDSLGRSVSTAGDVNGDGFDDIIIGADFAGPDLEGSYSNNEAGESYVVFGKEGSFSANLNLANLNGNNGFVLQVIDEYDSSGGISVSTAGDINGDGYDDLLIGAEDADPKGQDYAGESYVVFGKEGSFSASLNLANLNGNNGFVIQGTNEYDFSGTSVSTAGDINGDGFDDLLIGAFGADPAGESYVVFGKEGGFSASLNLANLNGNNGFVIQGIDEFVIQGTNEYDFSGGISVSTAGDINGDGFDDLLIGAFGADPNGQDYAGESYVVFGKEGGFSASLNLANLNGNNGFVLQGIDEDDFSGTSVSTAGDVNGDGFDDLLIGASGADPKGQDYAGESYVVFGKEGGFSASLNLANLNGSNGFVIQGVGEDDDSGTSVSTAGDVNGDGYGDLLIGAPLAGFAGESYVVFGRKFTRTSPGTESNDLLTGGAGDDNLNGGVGNDILSGGKGNDQLNGGSGSDTLKGRVGNDTYIINSATDSITEAANSGIDTVKSSVSYTLGDNLENLILTGTSAINGTGDRLKNTIAGNEANNTLKGQAGNDTMYGDRLTLNSDDGGNDILYGGAGNDTLYGDFQSAEDDSGGGNDTLYGGDGNDTLYADFQSAEYYSSGGKDILYGGDGNDTLNGGDGNDTLYGGDGDDTLSGGGGYNKQDSATSTLYGGDGNDTLSGGFGTNKLYGGNGNDTLVGSYASYNTLYGGAGNDILKGGDGFDSNNKLYGGNGDDTLSGDGSTNKLYGGNGDDTLSSSSYDSSDTLYGGDGDDTLDGSQYGALMYGGAGNDTLIAGRDSDSTNKLYGGDGDDTLDGGQSSASMYGGAGNDTLLGKGGNDILAGGGGKNTLTGGSGSDQFLYNTKASFDADKVGIDTIVDFKPGTDKIVLDKTTFAALTSDPGTGFSESGEFKTVQSDVAAATSDAFVTYSQGTGNLFYNQNGDAAGLGSGDQFANLTGIPSWLQQTS